MRLGVLCLATTACLLAAVGSSGSPASTAVGTIAFSERPFGPSFAFDIYTAPGSGGPATRVTHSTQDLIDPEISPDGTKIAYTACEEAHSAYVFVDGCRVATAVFVMNIDGTGAKQLTNWGANRDPSWSPDGAKIAYTSNQGTCCHIWTVNADGTDAARITGLSSKYDVMPTWSPDGKTIAFVRSRSLVALDLATGNVRVIVPWDGRDAIANPVWSPDGTQLAFSYGRALQYPQIDRVGADGTGMSRVASGGGQRYYPAWSPDGTRIAFVLCVNYICYGKQAAIEVVPATGGQGTRLLPATPDFRGWLSWRG
jgi:Tol biopolymer transport system component